SNLIYGPNGSGKSSLLAAVIWAFTGTTITDASDDKQDTDIHQKTDGTKKGTRIRSNWPLISTLPESNDIKSVVPDSWVTIELKTKDQSNTLYIKRSLICFEIGTDENNLKPCENLEEYGIKPIDLQISLIAPTVLSRNTLDNAESVIKILSLILGVDVLSDIGDLAANIGRNRTAYANTIKSEINLNWTSLQEKLARLPDPLDEKSPIREKLKDLVSKDKPTLKELTDKNILIQDEIDDANKNVAELLGVDSEDEGLREGLAEKLIEAIAYLEKDFENVFPSYSEIKYDAEQHGGKTLEKTEEEFKVFCVEARRRIEQRIDWWKKVKREGKKLELKLRASKDYDAERMECPVCDQS
ncbi:MAG: AAA family ATPase, partial [Nitrosopumilus sp.]